MPTRTRRDATRASNQERRRGERVVVVTATKRRGKTNGQMRLYCVRGASVCTLDRDGTASARPRDDERAENQGERTGFIHLSHASVQSQMPSLHVNIVSRQQCPMGVMQLLYTASMGGLQHFFQTHRKNRMM